MQLENPGRFSSQGSSLLRSDPQLAEQSQWTDAGAWAVSGTLAETNWLPVFCRSLTSGAAAVVNNSGSLQLQREFRRRDRELFSAVILGGLC